MFTESTVQMEPPEVDASDSKALLGHDDLLLSGLLLNRLEPMAPHHVSALRERLGYPTDDELREMLLTGKRA